MSDNLNKFFAQCVLKPYLTWYLKKPRVSHINGFKLLIKPTVFHPKYFFSSLYFYDFINSLLLKNTSFLEIGCGSGLLSLLAYKKNANVTCCDINPSAIECTKINFKNNFKENSAFTCIESDMLASIPHQTFDYVVINPPYFFADNSQQEQLAWNCGVNGEYFEKLFSQLPSYANKSSLIYMILAENCDITRISTIALKYHYKLILIQEKKIKWEKNYIFNICQIE